MKYNGCQFMTSISGGQFGAEFNKGPYRGADGVFYVSDGKYWQRDVTHSPVPVQGPETVITPELTIISESARRKASPVWSGVLNYFPDALLAVARVSKAGNDKHNPGQPLHWSRDKSNDHLDCAGRHLLTPFAIDPDSKEVHLANAAWRILAELQLYCEKQRAKD